MLGLCMDISRFTPNSPGRLVPVAGLDPRTKERVNAQAFIPDPLPERIPLSDRLILKLNEATVAVARLDEVSKRLPHPSLSVRPWIMREAVSSSALEGINTRLIDLMASQYTDRPKSAELREVTNYVDAAFLAYERIGSRPISLGLLRELHAILVAGPRSNAYQSGELRRTQVFIGTRRGGIATARFVPPPPGEALVTAMSAWEQWINTDAPIPALVKVALGHYQFETLHPFNDGNGRLGRLVMALQLVHEGLLHIPVLNISPFLEKHHDEYKDLMLHVSQTGDFESWMDFIFEGIRIQAEDACMRINKMVRIQDDLHDYMDRNRARGVVYKVIDYLIAYPVVTLKQISENHNVTFLPADNAAMKLSRIGYLEEITGKRYAKIYMCPQMMKALEGDIHG